MTHKKSYTVIDFYQFYLSNIERNTVYDIDYKLYRQIVTDYFKFIAEEVIEKVENLNFLVGWETLVQ